MSGCQRLAFIGQEGIAGVAVGQLPAFLDRTAMDRAAGQRLAGIQIGHLGIELERKLKRLLHRLQRVFRKAEDVVADHVDVGRPHRVADLADIDFLKAPLGDLLAHQLAAGFDAQRQPADAGAPKQIERGRPHGIDPRIRPHPQIELPTDDLFEQRLVIAPVQEKHFIADTHRLHPHAREFLELTGDEGRTPETHAARVGRMHIVAVVHPIDDIDHAEVAAEVAAERGINRGKRRALGVVKAGMPEMRAIHIQRSLAIGQQVPGIARQIDVHAFLWHHRLRRVHEHDGRALTITLLVADAGHPMNVALEVAAQQIVQGIDALVLEHDIDIRQRQHVAGQGAGVRGDESDRKLRGLRANFLREPSGTDHARSARIRVLAIDHEDHQARLERLNTSHRVGQRQLFGVAIENRAAETLGAAALCEQQRPGGRLDRGKG